jgi:hypothetical protein
MDEKPGRSVALGAVTLHLQRLTLAELQTLFQALTAEVRRRHGERQRTDAKG